VQRDALEVSASGPRRGSIAAGFAIAFAVGWQFVSVSADAPRLAADYRVGLSAIGLLTTIVFAVHTVLQLPVGRLADRYGPYRVGLVGLTVIVAANLAGLSGDDLWIALVARAAVGIGVALGFLTGLDYVRRVGGAAFLQGIYAGIPGAAAGIAFVVMPQVDPALSWRGPYVTGAAVAATALALLLTAPANATAARGASVGLPRGVTRSLLRRPEMVRMCVLNMASAGLTAVVGAWIVALFVHAGGYSAGIAGAIGSLAVFGSIGSRPLGGWILHHRPDLIRLTIAASIALGTAGLVAVAIAKPLVVALAGAASIGLASGLPWAYSFTGAARIQAEAAGTGMALVNMAGLVVTVALIPLVGLTFSLPGHGTIGFYAMAGLWALSIAALPTTTPATTHRR
jgi:hypothetical protein